jgi:hypothetical protein
MGEGSPQSGEPPAPELECPCGHSINAHYDPDLTIRAACRIDGCDCPRWRGRWVEKGKRPESIVPPEGYLLSGPVLEEVLLQVAGAATRPLLEDQPDYVFPAERVRVAVRQWVHDSPEIFLPAMSKAARLEHHARLGPPPKPRRHSTVMLTEPTAEYDRRVLTDHDVVVGMHGMVIKNRFGVAGIAAGPEVLAEARPVFPEDFPFLTPGVPFGEDPGKTAGEGFLGVEPTTRTVGLAIALAWVAILVSLRAGLIAVRA